ncbi:MAG: opacity family porin [Candidatus Eisenbacteria bacterium]
MTHRAWMLAALAIFLAAPAIATAGSIRGIEATLNTVFQKDQTSFSGVGLRLHVAGPASIPDMSFVPTMQYWSNRNNISAFGISSQRSDAALGLETRYTFSTVSLQPYLGASYGIHFMTDEVTTPATGSQSQTLTKGALGVLGGISVPLAGNLHNDFGLQYAFLGDRAQLKLDWGFRYAF